MFKKMLLAAALSGLMAAPANAQVYVEGQVGSALESEVDYNNVSFDVESDTAWGGAIGMTSLWGPFDVELDVLLTDRGYDGFATSLKSTSVLVNGIYNFQTGWPVTPYAGAGIGAIQVEYDGGSSFPAFSDEEWVFGWQALAGARLNVSERFGVFGEVRYQGAQDAELAGVDVEYNSVSVLLGGRFTFAH